MHPIERLRYVARASGAGSLLGEEAAGALAAFADDPAGLVTACRRLVDRHPASGPMWWLATRVLCAGDAAAEAWQAAEELGEDPTSDVLLAHLPEVATLAAVGLPHGLVERLRRRVEEVLEIESATVDARHLGRRLPYRGADTTRVPAVGLGAAVAAADLVVLEALAMGPGGWVGPAGSRAAAAVAHHARVPVWALGGVGRVLPGRLWQAVAARLTQIEEPWCSAEELVPLDLVDCVVGPEGLQPTEVAAGRATCAVAPELLRPPR